jgi:hypothetical protein
MKNNLDIAFTWLHHAQSTGASQGGQAVKAGSSYSLVSLGKELKDPQTGESLGHTETPCCDVVIDRVSSKLAYGHLENVIIDLGSIVTW